MRFLWNATMKEFTFYEPIESLTVAELNKLLEYAKKRELAAKPLYESSLWTGTTR